MKYSYYFGEITKEKGQLNLSSKQFRRMMNIVFLEGVISGLNRIRKTFKGTDQFYKYDIIIFKEDKKLTELTGNVAPGFLLEEMIKNSD